MPAHPPTSPLPRVFARARCLTCSYVIEGLSEPRCPECGRPFDPNDRTTYTRRPPFVRWKLWAPGFALAAGVGVGVTAVLALLGAWGWSLWIAPPLAAAALLGYRVRVASLILPLLALALMVPFIFGIAVMNIGGMFCGAILAVIIIVPLLAGLGIGAALRHSLKNSSFSQREWLPILIAVLFPLACAVIEGTPKRQALERIETSRTIGAPIDAAWTSIMFYEEVEHTPPLLLRIGLAHPLFTTGSSSKVGDIKTCIYNKGHITKEVSEVETHALLAFKVIEQRIGYERDVRLMGGSFAFEAIDERRTRVTLMTEYEPLLTPRFAWRWGERIAVRTLHNHVLEGMARNAEGHPVPEPAVVMSSHGADR